MNQPVTSIPSSAIEFMEAHSLLPEGIQQYKEPVYMESKVGRFVWDTLFSWIGFPHVKLVDETTDPAKPVYRLDFIVFGIRTHFWRLTPFGAYSIGLALYTMVRAIGPATFGMESKRGKAYIPKWAVQDALRHMAIIVQGNQDRVAFLKGEMNRLLTEANDDQQPVVTTQELLEADKPPTVH